MNNLISADWAKLNTQNELQRIKSSENYAKFLDSIYYYIRFHSNKGRLGMEINLSSNLLRGFSDDSVAANLYEDLSNLGYVVKFTVKGAFKKIKVMQVFWGLPEVERQKDGMGSRT